MVIEPWNLDLSLLRRVMLKDDLPALTAAPFRIPKTDRQQLMTLLEAVKHQEILSLAAVQKAVDSARLPSRSALKADEAGSPVNYSNTKPERLGSGDVDALMARLIQEEKRNQKPGLTQWSIYKVVAGLAAVLILIVLIV